MGESGLIDPANSSPPSETSASEAALQAAQTDEITALRSELEAARAEIVDLKDKFLRAKAETDNVRRRAELDVTAAYKFSVERFASEIVAVRDSLELARTVEMKGDPDVMQKIHEGLELTLKLLDGVFQKFSITLIDPKGEKFDPTRHQAISMVESSETPVNHVVNVVQKGYLLFDRVLRPAMVVVAREKPKESAANSGTDA
jgi:molecular chaperone GrpE